MGMESGSHSTMNSSLDRELIRVEFPDDRMGITAALRQAFAAAANERSTHDFDKLLSELN